MKTRELIKALVDGAGGALSTANAMGNRNFQGTISRLMSGETESPSPSTAKRLAHHFKIPVEALYDERVAAKLLREMRGQPPAPELVKAQTVREAVETIATALDKLQEPQRQEAAARMGTLAQAPDSVKAKDALVAVLAPAGNKLQAAA